MSRSVGKTQQSLTFWYLCPHQAPAAWLCASSFLHSSRLSLRVLRVLVLCSARPQSWLLRPKPVFSEAGCGYTSFYIFGGKKQESANGKEGPADQ